MGSQGITRWLGYYYKQPPPFYNMVSLGSRKNEFFFIGPTTKSLTLSSLVVILFFRIFLSFQESFFFLVAQPLPSPLLVDRPQKKHFYCGFP